MAAMTSTDDYDTEQQLFLLSYVDLLPDKIKMHPSTTQFRVALVMVGNATEIPMTFRVETTQPEFLRPNPLYGKIEPRGATFIVLYLLKVNYKQFKVRQDKLIVYTAVQPTTDERVDPINFWKLPIGPPKVQMKKVAQINYCFDETKVAGLPPLWAKAPPKLLAISSERGEPPLGVSSIVKQEQAVINDMQLEKDPTLESSSVKQPRGPMEEPDPKSKSETSSKSASNSKKAGEWHKKCDSK